MRASTFGAALAAMALLAAAPGLSAGEAKGKLTVDGKTWELKYAYAIGRPGDFDKTKEDIDILLTVEPVPDGDLGDMMPGRGPRLSITLDAEKKLTSGNVFFEGGNLSSNSGHEFTLKVFDGKRAEGRLYTKGPVKGASTTFQYDATFATDVWRKPKAVAATPADQKAAAASPQAVAYGAFLKAVQAGDQAGLRKLVVPEMAQQMDSPEFKQMFPMMQEMTPKQVSYQRVSESGDTATLEMTAPELGKGVATLQKVGGLWKVGRTKWTSSN